MSAKEMLPNLFILLLLSLSSVFVQYLAVVGLGVQHFRFCYSMITGNSFSWSAVTSFIAWAFLFLFIHPSRMHGPETASVSEKSSNRNYRSNGVLYYWSTMLAFIVLKVFYPNFPSRVYFNMSSILATLNVYAVSLCVYLFFVGKKSMKEKPILTLSTPIDFYRGVEPDPKILGVSVKQLTNCRIGMMGWQILILCHHFTAVDGSKLDVGFMVNILLQSLYIAKFFWWENGYFDTLDMSFDNAGFYICWGTVVLIPSLYTFSSYYFVAHRPSINTTTAICLFFLGTVAILLNYRVDYEKQIFRKEAESCRLYGSPVTFLSSSSHSAEEKSLMLLTSGFWGVARHMNYTFEILASLCWTCVGWSLGVWPFLYNLYLIVLLVHRIFRDEKKCSKKYGAIWDQYCAAVPYRLLPGIF